MGSAPDQCTDRLLKLTSTEYDRSLRCIIGLSALFYLMLTPKGEFLRTSCVGPISFSGSLYLVLSPKGEFLELPAWVPSVEWLFLSYIIGKKNAPYESSKHFLLLDGGADGRSGGQTAVADLSPKFFRCLKFVCKNIFFLNVFSY